MLIFIQFPIADARRFVSSLDRQLLTSPDWSRLRPYKDFVRHFGGIRRRARQGASGWLGENEICDASNAIKFTSLPAFTIKSSRNTGARPPRIQVKGIARHYYHDGQAMSQLVVVLRTTGNHTGLSEQEYAKLLQHILRMPVRVRTPAGLFESTTLSNVGKRVARLLEVSTVQQDTFSSYSEPHILAGLPQVWVEVGTEEAEISAFGTPVDIPANHQFSLLYDYDSNLQLPTWQVRLSEQAQQEDMKAGRILRLYVTRLHAEQECLYLILKHIEQGKVMPQHGTPQSNRLQTYLNLATRKISGSEKNAAKLIENVDIAAVARSSLEAMSPGQRDALLEKLDYIRPNIFRKVARYTAVIQGDYVEGDKITVGDIENAQNIRIGRQDTSSGP